MGTPKRILIAEDHAIMMDGLKAIISTESDYEVAATALDGIEAVRAVEKQEPDLVLMDLSMPKMNGFEATREIKALHPEVKVLVLSMHKSEEHVLEAFKAGADGYTLKQAAKDELLLALKSVFGGRTFISPLISDKVIEGFIDRAESIKEKSSWDSLTPRERQVLKLVAEGHTNKQIAELFFVSVKTVETHRSSIMRKLDLHSASELTLFASKKGLVG